MRKGIGGLILVLAVLMGSVGIVLGADAPAPPRPDRDMAPARLSLTDGRVSFWRPGAADWAQAQINTPLAPGDELATGTPGTLELQIGTRAFIRAWANTQLGLESQEPDFLQVKLTAGHASFDLRSLEPGQTVEVDTPNAAISLEHPGYYRFVVVGERTSIITRHGGRATVTPASGPTVNMTPSEELVIDGNTNPQMNAYAAPPLDDWDRWNYARTASLSESVSARYVPSGTYGVEELDRYGTWRTVPTYGEVWVPTAVPAGWVPYSTGSWVLDPYYGWTWVSSLPWGWAPFHYGRWVSVNGFWAWAPGPIVARPVYAPALVAFFGGPASLSVSVRGPLVGWVALAWGEPCVPWWGPAGFIHRPWWGGWGGPRVVNNVVINRTTVVNVESIREYHNTSAQNAVVAVNREHFGHGPVTGARVTRVDVGKLEPIHAGPPVQATSASFVPTATKGTRPSEEVLRRSVVATREPRPWGEAGRERRVGPAEPSGVTLPAPRIVTATRPQEPSMVLSRPSPGQGSVERPMSDRETPPAPPRRERGPRPATTRPTAPPVSQQPQAAPQAPVKPEGPPPTTGRSIAPSAPQGQSARPAAPVKPESPPPIAHGPVAPPPSSRPVPPAVTQQPQAAPQAPGPRREAGRPAGLQVAKPAPEASTVRGQHTDAARPLPGQPASRLAPQRVENTPGQRGGRINAPPTAHRPAEPAGDAKKQPTNEKPPSK